MLSGFVALPVRRPTATSMVFLALVLLGLFAWNRMPIELLPALSGEQLFVTFARPGSEPEVVEREILMPLQARAGELSGLKETWGEITGSSGRLSLEFERGSNTRVRELELRGIAAELNRTQPQGTSINVTSQDLTAFSRFAMIIHVLGGEDQNALRDLVESRIQARVAAVPGVSQVMATGGAPREVTVWVDPDRAAAAGVRPEQIQSVLAQSVQRLRYLGGSERDGLRWQVMLDGRPRGEISLGELRVDPSRPVLLRHVADIEMTTARAESAFRINGADATGLIVFQEEGANLVRLGRALRARLDVLRDEFAPYGVDFRIGFDAAETVETQLERLRTLAVWGFLIALIVLYLFLRELRAVAVVAVAVPVSLLIAGAILYLGGYTLNLITLLGLAVGVGMLVDNSVVVFESVQRFLERGLDAAEAAVAGIRRTVRAIITASATNAVVFLPALFIVEDSFIRGALELVAVAILVPLFASLVVAIGLVPLLAERLAAPAAKARLARQAAWRQGHPGLAPPQRARAVLAALLKSALRRPTPWLVTVTVAVVLTVVIALPWVMVNTLAQQAEQADQVMLQVELDGSSSLEAALDVFERIEQAVLQLRGIDLVESSFQEAGGSLTVHFDRDSRDPEAATPTRVRDEARAAIAGLDRVNMSTAGFDGGGGDGGGGGGSGGGGMALLGDTGSQVLISGPDMVQINLIAREIQSRLQSMPEVDEVRVTGSSGRDEMRIQPLAAALTAYRLTPDEVLGALNVMRREGVQLQVGFTLADGREIPLTVRREEAPQQRALQSIQDLRLATEAGALPLGAVTTGSRVAAPPAISHHNGRRELSVTYTLSSAAPETGPERLRLEEAIQEAVRSAYRPPGYTVEATGAAESTDWFRLLLVPVLLLLFAVLAIAFESFTLPVLVLLAVPLTILGATWALVLAGVGAGVYALVGVIALLGLTVNPAILLVDRMQQRVRASACSGGAAAIAAVRERTRPVLMTSCTTIAGLWPLALSTGDELEIWPPFATVVMGGLATSTLLTLLVIPVGFVLLSRLDRVFGRLGPWIVMAWLAATAAIVMPLVMSDVLVSLTWQIITTALVAGALLWLVVAMLHREPALAFSADATPIGARYLQKVYGRPGEIARAWQLGGGTDSAVSGTRRDAAERALTFAVLLAGSGYLALSLDGLVWRVLFTFLSAAFAARGLMALMQALATGAPQAHRAHVGALIRYVSPYLMLAVLCTVATVLPMRAGAEPQIPAVAFVLLVLITAFAQIARRSARRGVKVATRPADDIAPSRLHEAWHRFCRTTFGFDLPRPQVHALAATTFSAQRGMVGILGPNGAGKTTLLRVLAGVLEPSAGSVHYSGHTLRRARKFVSRWVGYLPQEFGLPNHLTAQQYLDYFALLYDVGDLHARRERVDRLLKDVGLADKRHERIGGFSGGMRQRVAVARTLLREPPIIIVDEPTVGLDPRERIRFRNLLAKLAEGRVVLFSTHVVEDVAVACRRVIVMSRGRIVFDGEPEALAGEARGRTWELRLAADEAEHLPPDCRVVDRVPDAAGGTRLRILNDTQPHPNAQPAAPGIEDGYLQLVTRGGARAA